MSDYRSTCRGVLLGVTCGDALGSPCEFRTPEQIRARWGVVRDMVGTEKRRAGFCTDDTALTLAVARGLVRAGGVDVGVQCEELLRTFQGPPRGYGPATMIALLALANGASPDQAANRVHPQGSWSSGGAMRIAPVGLAYRHAGADVLWNVVRAALSMTHIHVEAQAAAFVLADLVGRLATDGEMLNGKRIAPVVCPPLHEKLGLITSPALKDAEPSLVYDAVCAGCDYGRHFAIRAIEAVPLALWHFCRNFIGARDPERAVIEAVNCGGDADTVGGMVGALCGAMHGDSWIPRRWLDNLEAGAVDKITALAEELSGLDVGRG